MPTTPSQHRKKARDRRRRRLAAGNVGQYDRTAGKVGEAAVYQALIVGSGLAARDLVRLRRTPIDIGSPSPSRAFGDPLDNSRPRVLGDPINDLNTRIGRARERNLRLDDIGSRLDAHPPKTQKEVKEIRGLVRRMGAGGHGGLSGLNEPFRPVHPAHQGKGTTRPLREKTPAQLRQMLDSGLVQGASYQQKLRRAAALYEQSLRGSHLMSRFLRAFF